MRHRSTSRPARHYYYDVYQIARHQIGRDAIRDHRLLADVVRHKSVFYPRSSDRYDLAKPGTLTLVPPADVAAAIEPDYREMGEEMVFGEAPAFDDVLITLRDIERQVNAA